MGISDISLTASMRTNLFSLQSTTNLLSRTQERLASGKKVNSALDNPTNFFAAQSHTQRASDLSIRKDGMTEAVQGTMAANKGITAISALIDAAKGLMQTARSADFTNREALAKQFNNIREQIDSIASDSSYKGKNFLKSDTLNVLFNESGGAVLKLSGFDSTSVGLGLTAVTIGIAASSVVATGGLTLTGTGVVNIATGHVASLSTAMQTGTVALSSHFIGTSGILASGLGASGVTGFLVSLTTGLMANMTSGGNLLNIISGYLATSGGNFDIKKVYVDGVDQTALLLQYVYVNVMATGTAFTAKFTGVAAALGADLAAANVKTGSSITFGMDIKKHTDSGGWSILTGYNVYDLQGGDLASGLSLNAIATGSGIQVFISGTQVSTSGYSIDVANNRIIFNVGQTPPSTTGAVTYSYNTGFIKSGTLMMTEAKDFSAQILSSNQEITNVMVNGVTGTLGSTYTITSGNQIHFTVGLTTGASVTYSVKTTTAQVDGGWTNDLGIDASVEELTAALAYMRTQSANLASNLSVINVRQEFTDGMVTTLLKGADNLTLADMNEEGANMLMLQTRQQLGTTSLKMASDTAAAVMRLF